MPRSRSCCHHVLFPVLLGPVLSAPTLATQELPSAPPAQEIIVTADPMGNRSIDAMIQPVTVLTGDALDRRRAGTIGDILDGLPGVASADFGPGVGRPTIRGQQGSRVVVLDDGIRVADVSGEGADHAIALEARGAEQIEVFRGPTTLLYGSGAAGGVVNVRSRRFLPAGQPGTRAIVDSSYGGNGQDRLANAHLEHVFDADWAFRADWGLRRSNDFAINGFQEVDQDEGFRNRLQNSSINTDSASGTLIYTKDWGNLGFGASRWRTDYGVPTVFDPQRNRGDGSDEFERIVAQHTKFDLRSTVNNPFAGWEAMRLNAAYTDFDQQEIGFGFSRVDGQLEDSEVEAEFGNKEFEARIDLVHQPIGAWRGVLGLQYNDRDFLANDPGTGDAAFYVRPTRTRTLAAFMIEERRTDFGQLELGARVERIRATPEDILGSSVQGITQADGTFLSVPTQLDARTLTPVSLSAGTIIALNRMHQLRVGLSLAERAPTAEQLFAFGRHAAAGTFEIGNPALSLERYNNLEIGLERREGRFHYEATAFYNRADNYIYFASEDDGTGSPVFVNDVGDRAGERTTAACGAKTEGLCGLSNQLVINTQQNAAFHGAELAARYQVVDGLRSLAFTASADIIRGTLRGAGDLPRITPGRFGAGIEGSWNNTSFSLDYQRVNSQNRIGEAESRTAGYHLLSADLQRNLRLSGQEITFYVRGRNLLNEAGRRHHSFFKDAAPVTGRAIYAGLRMTFGN
jgi:iron complex outermembrane receptor protein